MRFQEARSQWVAELEQRIMESCAADGLVGTMCSYHLSSGGKRLRAILPVWVCHELGGEPAAALDFGAGVELLHNATLVHDDIQDGDSQRRGRPTVWKRWGADQAINAGDALVFTAMSRIACAPAGPSVLPLVCRTMVRLIEGQALDIQVKLPRNDPARVEPTLDLWLQIARHKTAALFALCFELGAIAAHAGEQEVAAARSLGESIGLLFQVQDDLFDIIGEEENSAADNISLAPTSFPVLWAYRHAPELEVARLRAWFERPSGHPPTATADEILAILDRTGALSATLEWVLSAQRSAAQHGMAAVVPGLLDSLTPSRLAERVAALQVRLANGAVLRRA